LIIVDDRLALDVLAGRAFEGEACATTWGFHYRLVRTLTSGRARGRLSSALSDELVDIVLEPPASQLAVLDPRQLTKTAAQLAARYDLNLLGAELFAAAVVYRAAIRLSSPNVGRRWRAVASAAGVSLDVT
jgi:hypothetical protein